MIAGYKSDLYIADTETIIEIKSVISTNKEAQFPTVYSERTLLQLAEIENLLSEGRKVLYCIVSLNPYVTCVRIDTETPFYSALKQCVKKGMILKAYSAIYSDSTPMIKREIAIQA